MTTKENKQNVGRIYRQQVLSGFEHINQPENKDGDSPQDEQGGTKKLPKQFWQSKSYKVSFSVIIEKTGTSGNEHKFAIRLNDDDDISISAYSKQSKRVSKETVEVPASTGAKTVSLPMVYGVHESGNRALSPTDGNTLQRTLPSVYSNVLVKLDRAIQRIVLEQENPSGNDDTGQRLQGDVPQEKLGANKAKRRSGKVLPKVRNETVPEANTRMVDKDRQVLGSGLRDI